MAFGTLKVTGMFGQVASPRLPLALLVVEAEGAVPATAAATFPAPEQVMFRKYPVAVFEIIIPALHQWPGRRRVLVIFRIYRHTRK